MRRNIVRVLFSSLVLVAFFSLAGDAFGQGRGRGRGDRDNDRKERRDNDGDRGDRGNGRYKKQDRDLRQSDRREAKQVLWQERRNDRGRDRKDDRRSDRGRDRRDDRRVIYQREDNRWQGIPIPARNYDRQRRRANWVNERRDARDYWKDQRKASRNFWKFERKREQRSEKFWRRVAHQRDKQDRRYWRQQSGQRRAYAYYNNYDQPAYSYYPEYQNNGRGHQIIQVISGILGGGSPVYFDNTPQYSNYRQPVYNQPQIYQPQYVNYSQYDPYQYDDYSNGYENGEGSLLGLLPDEFSSGLIGQLLANFLGSAYGRGYDDALYAQDYGNDQRYAASPYVNYTPAVVSNDQAQQIFSEGYELGYRDAIASSDASTGTGIGGNALDLVNLFLGNSLSV